MKNIVKSFVLALMLTGFMAIAQISLAQAPPPPPVDKGTNTNKAPGNGGGAPIDGGVVLSLAMVAGFGGWKLYKSWKCRTA
jgi:hypothetical protein